MHSITQIWCSIRQPLLQPPSSQGQGTLSPRHSCWANLPFHNPLNYSLQLAKVHSWEVHLSQSASRRLQQGKVRHLNSTSCSMTLPAEGKHYIHGHSSTYMGIAQLHSSIAPLCEGDLAGNLEEYWEFAYFQIFEGAKPNFQHPQLMLSQWLKNTKQQHIPSPGNSPRWFPSKISQQILAMLCSCLKDKNHVLFARVSKM